MTENDFKNFIKYSNIYAKELLSRKIFYKGLKRAEK